MAPNPFDDPALASGYEAWYADQGRRADRLEKALLRWFIAHFPRSGSILEVGCGTGHFTRWFEGLGLRAVGLDISAIMLEIAKGHGGDLWVHGDASDLPFPGGAFDLLAMITTLEFLDDPLAALREAGRVARKGLILGVINRESWIARRYRRQGSPPWESAHFFNPGELIHLLRTIDEARGELFWRTTLYRFTPWASKLPWGGFIGIGLRLGPEEETSLASSKKR